MHCPLQLSGCLLVGMGIGFLSPPSKSPSRGFMRSSVEKSFAVDGSEPTLLHFQAFLVFLSLTHNMHNLSFQLKYAIRMEFAHCKIHSKYLLTQKHNCEIVSHKVFTEYKICNI